MQNLSLILRREELKNAKSWAESVAEAMWVSIHLPEDVFDPLCMCVCRYLMQAIL